ncbi:hypothetical protein JW859_10395 [bacterium]|nr:hypothetical protein [bacterium]
MTLIYMHPANAAAETPGSGPDKTNNDKLLADPQDQESVGGQWHYQRLVDGEIVDEGFLVVEKGKWVFTEHQSNSGGVLSLCALLFPFEPGGRDFSYKQDKRYFDGRIPEVGRIFAIEHEPGETWVFDYNGYIIVDDEGFVPGLLEFEITCELADRWSETWTGSISNGAWAEVNCSGQTDYLIGSSGMQWEELSPEYRELGLVEIKFPVCRAHFYGRCHEEGELWTVKIGGEICTTVVAQKDPLAIPLDAVESECGSEEQ